MPTVASQCLPIPTLTQPHIPPAGRAVGPGKGGMWGEYWLASRLWPVGRCQPPSLPNNPTHCPLEGCIGWVGREGGSVNPEGVAGGVVAGVPWASALCPPDPSPQPISFYSISYVEICLVVDGNVVTRDHKGRLNRWDMV